MVSAETELRSAADEGNVEKVQEILAKNRKIKVDAADEWGSTPLYLAVKHGHVEVARLLLEHGANVHFSLPDGWTLVHSAVHQNNTQLVELLLKNGAAANSQDNKGKTPLMVAQQQHAGNARMMQILQDANSWWRVMENLTGSSYFATSSVLENSSNTGVVDSSDESAALLLSKQEEAQKKPATIPKQFQSRAELDAEIQACQKLVDIASKEFDENAIERGLKAEARLQVLKPLTKNYPSLEDLQNEITEIESQMMESNAIPLQQRLVLAKRLKKLKEMQDTEQKARRFFLEPVEIMESSDLLYKSFQQSGKSPTELLLSYIKYRINNLSNRLGGGAFCNTYQALDTQHSIRMVISRYNPEHLKRNSTDGNDNGVARKELIRDIKAMFTLKHDNLTRVLGYCFPTNNETNDNDTLCIVHEYASGGSLASVLARDGSSLSWQHRIDIACSVASALYYMHRQGYVHRDLKPSSICFSTNKKRVLLTGWSLCKLVTDETYAATCRELQCWSDPYVAPEYKSGTIQQICDVYSFGFILQSLVTGKVSGLNKRCTTKDEMMDRVDTKAGEWDAHVLTSLVDLALRCMDTDPTIRPDFNGILDVLVPLKTKSVPKATPSQQELITSSLENSRYNHGWKDVSRDSGMCLYCLRETDPGIVCNRNSNPHFVCKRCFAEYVKKNIGVVDLKCRESGCVSEPFAESQLEKIIEPALLAQHFAAVQIKRFELQSDRARADNMSRLDLNQLRLILAAMHKGDATEYPKLMVLSKPRDELGGGELQQFSDDNAKNIYILYFICASDLTKINTPIVLKRTSSWVQKMAPALLVSLYMIRTSLLCKGVSSFENWLKQLELEGLYDEGVCSRLLSEGNNNNIEKMLMEMSMSSKSNMTKIWNGVQKLTREANDDLSKIAKANPSWQREMKLVKGGPNGSSAAAWVKNCNVDKYKAKSN